MWALNKYWSLIASSGESRAITSTTSDSANQVSWARVGPCQPCRRQSGPAAYM